MQIAVQTLEYIIMLESDGSVGGKLLMDLPKMIQLDELLL